MKSISSKDLEKVLLSKGFRKQEGGNHRLCFFYANGKRTRIKVPISRDKKKDYTGGLLGQVQKQMKLDKEEFTGFVKCSISEDKYYQILVDKGHLE